MYGVWQTFTVYARYMIKSSLLLIDENEGSQSEFRRKRRFANKRFLLPLLTYLVCYIPPEVNKVYACLQSTTSSSAAVYGRPRFRSVYVFFVAMHCKHQRACFFCCCHRSSQPAAPAWGPLGYAINPKDAPLLASCLRVSYICHMNERHRRGQVYPSRIHPGSMHDTTYRLDTDPTNYPRLLCSVVYTAYSLGFMAMNSSLDTLLSSQGCPVMASASRKGSPRAGMSKYERVILGLMVSSCG